MPICAVFGCNNSERLHRFPKHKGLRDTWAHRCYRKDEFNVTNARMCASHFDPLCFERDLRNELLGLPPRNMLKADAVPTLLLPSQTTVSTSLSTDRSRNIEKREKRKLITAALSAVSDEVPEKRGRVDSSSVPETAHGTRVEGTKPPQKEETKVANRDVKEVRRLRAENVRLQVKVKSQLRKIATLQQELKKLKEEQRLSKTNAQERVRSLLKGCFTPGQIQCLQRGNKRTRWSSEDLQVAMSLRSLSRKTYNFLRKERHFPLPGISTLTTWVQKMPCKPGLQVDSLYFLQSKFSEMEVKDRCAVLSVDEMNLKTEISYSRKDYQVYGPHKKLVVVMARGLFTKWKQPIYFNFDIVMTPQLFRTIVLSLETRGFPIHAVVSDMGRENRKLWKDLGVNSEQTWITNLHDQNRRIFFFADTPHLLKVIRNHAIDHGLHTPKGLLDKKVFEELLSVDNGEYKLCHKISATDIDLPKASPARQRVRPAARILSERVSKAIVHVFPDKQDLANLILTFDQFFDTLNSRVPYADKQLRCGFGVHMSKQMEALAKMENLTLNMRVGKPKSTSVPREHLLPFQNGVLMTIRSLRQLFPELQALYKVRGVGGFNRHPSPLDAINNIRKIVIGASCGQILTGNTVESIANDPIVTADVCREALGRTELDAAVNASASQSRLPDDVPVASVAYTESEKGGLEYVAGYVAFKLRANHPELGSKCGEAVVESPSWVHWVSRGGLTSPSAAWLDTCKRLDAIFTTINNEGLLHNQPLHTVLSAASSAQLNAPEEAIRLFLKTRLFIRLKHLNKEVRSESQKKRSQEKTAEFKK